VTDCHVSFVSANYDGGPGIGDLRLRGGPRLGGVRFGPGYNARRGPHHNGGFEERLRGHPRGRTRMEQVDRIEAAHDRPHGLHASSLDPRDTTLVRARED